MVSITSRIVRAALFFTLITAFAFALGWMLENINPNPMLDFLDETPIIRITATPDLSVITNYLTTIEKLKNIQQWYSFEIKVPTKLPPGWKYQSHFVDTEAQYMRLDFKQNESTSDNPNSLYITQQLNAEAGSLKEILGGRTSLWDDSRWYELRVGQNRGVFAYTETSQTDTIPNTALWLLGWMEEDVLFTIVYLGNDPNLDFMVKMGERLTPLSLIVP